MIMKKLLVLFFSIAWIYCSAQFPRAEIPGTQVRTITSSVIPGQEYKLQIMLPGGYSSSNKKYPVVYLMDSQWDFPLVTALYGEQYYDGFIPELIVVGVTWGGTNPNADSLRARDYTPSREARLPQSGGAANFLLFMKTELFPFIESNYKADKNDRALMGCSLGGLFTLYALFAEPGLFQRYVATSPAFGWDREVIYQYEKKYFETLPTGQAGKTAANARLYMVMGGVERNLPGYEKWVKHLNNRNYTSLKIGSRVLDNTGHSGTKGEGFARGLQYAYERPNITLDDVSIKKYTGSYRNKNGNTIELKKDGTGISFFFNPNSKYELKAANETDFYSDAEFFNIKFRKDDSGHVTGFDLMRWGNAQLFEKIK
jgi:predicted alpha/beta superfamily hydrolase